MQTQIRSHIMWSDQGYTVDYRIFHQEQNKSDKMDPTPLKWQHIAVEESTRIQWVKGKENGSVQMNQLSPLSWQNILILFRQDLSIQDNLPNSTLPISTYHIYPAIRQVFCPSRMTSNN